MHPHIWLHERSWTRSPLCLTLGPDVCLHSLVCRQISGITALRLVRNSSCSRTGTGSALLGTRPSSRGRQPISALHPALLICSCSVSPPAPRRTAPAPSSPPSSRPAPTSHCHRSTAVCSASALNPLCWYSPPRVRALETPLEKSSAWLPGCWPPRARYPRLRQLPKNEMEFMLMKCTTSLRFKYYLNSHRPAVSALDEINHLIAYALVRCRKCWAYVKLQEDLSEFHVNLA